MVIGNVLAPPTDKWYYYFIACPQIKFETYLNYCIPQKNRQILATAPPIVTALVREYRKLILCKWIISISTQAHFFFLLFYSCLL